MTGACTCRAPTGYLNGATHSNRGLRAAGRGRPGGLATLNFMRRNWYYVGGGLCAGLVVVLVLAWNDLSVLRRLLLVSFMALLVHQLEEYAWPGGFPAVMNVAWMPGKGALADRYPLNRQGALFVNVMFAYPYYVLPIVFPSLTWMGLGQVWFGVAQLGIHGIVINRKLRSIYNPGLFAVVFLHVPIGAYYTWYIAAHGLAAWWTWPIAIAWVAFGAVMGVAMPVTKWFASRDSSYPFSEREMARFHVKEKVEALQRLPHGRSGG